MDDYKKVTWDDWRKIVRKIEDLNDEIVNLKTQINGLESKLDEYFDEI